MTYSIVARCPETGQLGVAVQSHFFSVGGVVTWAEAGVGAVATQASAEVAHGPNTLDRLRDGRAPTEALADVLGPDPHAETRQLAAVDREGRAACHTGASCIVDAGHIIGDGYSVQANMMFAPGVPEAMSTAFSTSEGPLAERLLAVLDAAEAAGGDIRGRQSAAMLIVRAEPSGKAGEDRLVDIRVEDHVDPLGELRRLVDLSAAYRRMGDAETAMSELDFDAALAIYAESVAAHPRHPEFAFWHAVVLAGLGRIDQARAAVAPVFDRADGDRWRELLRRLPATGTIPADAVAALLD